MLDEPHPDTGRSHTIRQPSAEDGAAVHDLIAACPPLDRNSLYCNLIQCSHFAHTCAIAENGDEILGFVSGHIPPNQPDTLFIWQVAIAEAGRGKGLAKALILDILNRPGCRSVKYIDTTITDDNAASWAMFHGLARKLGAETSKTAMFEKDTHFKGRHDTEHLLRIGPFEVADAS